MSALNRVILIGNLTRDPELRYTPSGTPVANFTLAVNRPNTDSDGQKRADFIPVVVWRQQAERCSSYLAKGSQVAIDGKLQIRSYDDRDGIRRTVAEVVAWRVIFLQRLRQQPSAGIEEEVSFDDAGNDIGTISIDEEGSMDLEEPNGSETDT